MRCDTAIKLISQLAYKPGWELSATDHTKRFEQSICLCVKYPAANSDRPSAEDNYSEQVEPFARAQFVIMLGDSWKDVDLYRAIIDILMKVELHEAREFLRVRPTYWAPFHPHQWDGMRLWGDPQTDVSFGVA